MTDLCYFSMTTIGKQELDNRKKLAYQKVWKRRAILVIQSGSNEPVEDTIDNKHSVFGKSFIQSLKNNKKTITTQLKEVRRENEIAWYDIKDGQIIYSKTKVKVPLNKKTMYDLLAKYFNNDNQADNLVNYIMENREEKEKESIKRKINN